MPEGCVALAALASRIPDVPVNSARLDRDIPPTEAGVANRAVPIGANRDARREAISGLKEPILTIGGDCGVEFEPIRGLGARYGAGLGVAWFDPHPDLKTPETAHDGAYHAMVLARLPGEGDPELRASDAVDPAKVALIDARAAIDAEKAAIKRGQGIHADEAATVLRETTHIYIQVDVDVLDLSEFDGHNMPEPDGMKIGELVASVETLSGFNVVGAGIAECVGRPQQVEVLAPVIAKIGELLEPRTS